MVWRILDGIVEKIPDRATQRLAISTIIGQLLGPMHVNVVILSSRLAGEFAGHVSHNRHHVDAFEFKLSSAIFHAPKVENALHETTKSLALAAKRLIILQPPLVT